MARSSVANSTLRFEVWREDDLLLADIVAHGRALRIGPSIRAHVPATLQDDLDLLAPTTGGGYGLFLDAPLSGQINVGDRKLRVVDGLLVDPRPEPLRLRDGDQAAFELAPDEGTSLQLRVFVCEKPSLSWFNPLDWNLGITLTGTTLAALVLAMFVLASPAPNSPRIRPLVLVAAKISPSLLARPFKPQPARANKRLGQVARRGSHGAVTGKQRRRRARRQSEKRTRAALERADTALSGLLSMAPRPARSGSGSSSSSATIDPLLASIGKIALPSSLGAAPRVRLSPATRSRRPQLAKPSDNSGAGPTRGQIAKVVSRGSGRIQHCFERELLASGHSLAGKILLRWKVDLNGRVLGLQVVSDTVGSKTIQRCVMRTVARWQFPSDHKTYAVVFPFEFLVRS